MALTPLGKKFVLDNDMKTVDMFVGLAVDATNTGVRTPAELSEVSGTAYGYSRGEVPTSGRSTTNTGRLNTGVGSGSELAIFTPSAGGAPDFTHVALFSALTGGDQLTDWQPHSDQTVAAPVNGQPYRLNALTFDL